MTRSWIQSLLWTVSAIAGLAAIGFLVWSIGVSTSPDRIAGASASSANHGRSVSPVQVMSMVDLSPIWQVDVRHPIGSEIPAPEPASVVVATLAPESVAVSPTVRVRLVATAIDGQRPCAIFYDEQQRPIVREVGELIDGVRLSHIERRKVTLEHASGPIDLTVPELFPPATRNVP